MNLSSIFWDNGSKYQGRSLIHLKNSSFSFDEIADRIKALSYVLCARGVGRGDRVILAMNNSVDWLVSFFSILGAGAIVVPVNPALRPFEMSRIASHCSPAFAIMDADLQEHFLEYRAELPRILRGGHQDEFEGLAAKSVQNCEIAQLEPSAPAMIFYTSGTTGVPKGVVLSHSAEINAAQMTADYIGIQPTDSVIVMGSLAFVYPLVINALSSMVAGASIVLMERFHPELVSTAIRERGVTIIMGVPTMFTMLMDYADKTECDFSSVRLSFSGGANLSEALCEKARKRGINILDFWGLTECTPVSTFNPRRDQNRKPESCGQTFPGISFKVVDDDLKPIPLGEVGEILLTGPTIMSEYYLNPSATRDTLIDGWIRTGDLGRADKDGYLYLVGRKKDLIIRGGANIYPLDIEEILYSYSDVSECAVVGKPDAIFGEIVCAFVVRKSATLTADALVSHCRQHLSEYKIPTQFYFVNELPKGPTGKILLNQLRELASVHIT